MKVISWNVNGIRSVYRKGFCDFLTKEKPDILCLQEVRASKDKFPEKLSVFGYEMLVNPADKQGYSGVAVFLKKNFLKVKNNLGDKRIDGEGRFIQVDFGDFILINVYVPHGGRSKENILHKLSFYKKIIAYVKSLEKAVVLVGDFNVAHKEIDLARPKDNKNNIMFTEKERVAFKNLLSLGLVDSFRAFNKSPGKYTWWSYMPKARLRIGQNPREEERRRNVGWRIDYILFSKGLTKRVKDAFILKDVYGSDHCPIGIKMEI